MLQKKNEIKQQHILQNAALWIYALLNFADPKYL